MKARLLLFVRDARGATLVEFALIAPVLITMLLGVIQVGSWVQGYNAVRNVVNETSRFATVEYLRGNKVSNEAIETRARQVAASAKYSLVEDSVNPTVSSKTTQVNGVRQMNLKIVYQAPTFVPFVGAVIPAIQYNRDIYVYDDKAVAGV
jgi:Flp pilus assembly protein TadG